MVNSWAFVKQKRFKLHLLYIIKCIKHDCKELERDRENSDEQSCKRTDRKPSLFFNRTQIQYFSYASWHKQLLLLHEYIRLHILEEVKTRLFVPGSWWSRALWRGKQWRRHRTSGSWSKLASSRQGNYKKEETRRYKMKAEESAKTHT